MQGENWEKQNKRKIDTPFLKIDGSVLDLVFCMSINRHHSQNKTSIYLKNPLNLAVKGKWNKREKKE